MRKVFKILRKSSLYAFFFILILIVNMILYSTPLNASEVVSGGIVDSEVQFGGLQKKVVYASGNWYSFYNDGTDVLYKKSSDGISWGSAVDVDTTDADNFNPSVWLEGSLIYVAWIDDSADAIEVNTINTASSDDLGIKCTSADQGTIGSTFTVSISVADDDTVYFAYSDTSTDTEVGVFSLTFSGCTFTDITFASEVSGSSGADTLVETAVDWSQDTRRGVCGPYWSDVSVGVIVFIDNALDISFARTTDKGANWSTTEIDVGSTMEVACWYDKETPEDSGTLVHITWLDSVANDAYYITVDVADGSLGTKRTIDSTLTVSGIISFSHIAITKAVNGNIIVCFSTQAEIECYKSSDNFATAGTDIADVYETTTEEDWVLLFPADVDAGDAAALFWDKSADELSLKMYDDSGDSWTETSISGSVVDSTVYMNMDGAVRLSDSHILIAAHSDDDNTGDDLRTWDLTVDSIASPTVTAKTNIFTNQGESAQVSVFINQQNDDVYVAYLKGGTWLATVDVVFHISDDDMGTWGSEQAYSESAADDFRLVHAGRTVTTAGGRYQPAFYDDDQIDIYVNGNNDIGFTKSGLTAGDRPVVTTIENNLDMIFQDGDLSHSVYDGTSWTTANEQVANVTDNVYDLTTDGANIWILTVSGTTATNFYKIDIVPTITDIDTNVGTTSDVSIYCPTADDCKVVYFDDVDDDITFVDCNDATCSAPTITDIDTDATGGSVSIYCPTATDCKVVYSDTNDNTVVFVDCNDASCSAPTLNNIDTNTPYASDVSIYCPTADDCKVAYYDADSDVNVEFVDCNDAACSSRTITVIDGDGGSGSKVSIYCPTATDCKVAYYDGGSDDDITFVDCNDATCSAPTITDIDTDVGNSVDVSIYCPTATDCKVVYFDNTDDDITFVDCNDATCSAPTITDIDTDATGGSVSIYCPTATDCKVAYFDGTDDDITFADCNDATCSAPTINDIDTDAGAAGRVSIYCPTATDCKVAYFDWTDRDITFADCNNAACWGEGVSTPTAPWTSETAVETVSITYDSTNSDIYAHIIKDTSDQAYFNSTDATTISWGTETSYAFTAGDLAEISAPLTGTGNTDIGVVLRQGSNFEFASVVPNSTPTAPTTLYVGETTAQSGLADPVNVGDTTPVFSALCNDPDSGDILNKYQIQVDNDSDFSSTTWDSGSSGTGLANCTEPSRSADITFGGTALEKNRTTYYWRIKFWDDDGTEGVWSAGTDTFQMLGPQSQLKHGLYFFNKETKRIFTF